MLLNKTCDLDVPQLSTITFVKKVNVFLSNSAINDVGIL